MTRWETLYGALCGAVLSTLAAAGLDAQLTPHDVKRPITRRQIKVDLTDYSECGDEEQSLCTYDAELYFYPRDGDHPREECVRATAAITSALRAGLRLPGVHVEIPEGVRCEVIGGVLAGKLALSWLEVAAEDGEPMEELIFEEETQWQ